VPGESEFIHWVIDEDGNVLTAVSTYAGEYKVGDLFVSEGKTRRIVEKVSTEDHPDVIWVKTVIEPE
jgi:hypothetical protein